MNIADLLTSLGVEYRVEGHHCSAGWVQLPFCPGCCAPGDDRYRLGVNIKSRVFNCWSCGRLPGGETLAAITGLGVSECISLLGGCEGEWTAPVRKKRGRLVVPEGVGELLPAHRRYLEGRRIDPDYASRVWGVRGIGVHKRLPWRLWMPVRLEKTLSWTTRTIGNGKTRYVTASPDEEEVSHKELLFGEDLAGNSVVCCEGPMDAIKFGVGAVATFGIAWTVAQAMRLSRFAVRTIVFDNEWKAQERARELADQLECYPGRTMVVEIDAPDVGSASEKELAALRKLL